ncbi:hypothetical protein [Polluticoccus soli]|uniref:hypothetical protein n=1 Tax=Polluticoccus soli TaxID=3034150 RepID=UPI0023E0C7D6|nr:hypothetical protein [Flavipsychrobacter sp. JY13-12]
MEDNQKSPEQSQGDLNKQTPGREDAAKTPPQKTESEIEETDKKREGKHQKKKVSADAINSIIGSATDRVRSHRIEDRFSNTGTNVSYTKPTSTAAGGTGYNSGQPATGPRTSGSDEYDAGGLNREEHKDDDTKDTI